MSPDETTKVVRQAVSRARSGQPASSRAAPVTLPAALSRLGMPCVPPRISKIVAHVLGLAPKGLGPNRFVDRPQSIAGQFRDHLRDWGFVREVSCPPLRPPPC